MKLSLILFSLVFIFIQSGFGQFGQARSEYCLMFYNTENLFDCENDSLTSDEEFTPESDRRWISGRLYAKAERIGKVILAAGKWNPPIIAGLCEVENLNVLEILTRIEPLKKFQYKIVHKDSPDERGIDVALIYRPEFFKPFEYSAIAVKDSTDESFNTRDILRVSGVLNNCDTVHVFVNHWPSRYGGVMETKKYRKLAAETLKNAILKLYQRFPAANIICMGDFNDSPKDESIVNILGAMDSDNLSINGELVNLSTKWLSYPIQTIKSQYTWDVFDQIVVSDYFLEKGKCYEVPRSEIFDAAFLLESDIKFGGVKPKRTYVGFKYQEGFSDHLPVVLRFQLTDH